MGDAKKRLSQTLFWYVIDKTAYNTIRRNKNGIVFDRPKKTASLFL